MRNFLEGSGLRLCLTEKDHLKKRVEFINDPEVQQTLNYDYPTSLSKTEAWFSKVVLDPSRVEFTIIEKAIGSIVGFCGFINIDRMAKKAEHHIFIGDKQFWGKGYGKEAYKLLTNYGFMELGLNRIYGYHLEYNERAKKTTESIGWTLEGCLREDVFSHGAIKSRFVVAILRGEWAGNEIYDDV
jgi:RimJ/RimL family protein N-acetyltransferase